MKKQKAHLRIKQKVFSTFPIIKKLVLKSFME